MRRILGVLVLAALLIACPCAIASAAVTAVTGTLTEGSAVGTAVPLTGNGGNLSIGTGWTGTIDLQRSFDGGASWEVVTTITTPTTWSITDLEPGVQYRLEIHDLRSWVGSAAYRLSSW